MKSGSNEWCAMMLAKDNYYHNIPKEWITEKVWAVLLKNPVYKDYVKENAIYVNKNLQKDAEITPKETETAQENDAPATIEEIPIHTMANETANCTSNANETNVNKNLPKTVAKTKKNNYINTTNETKTTKTGDNSMMNNKEIAKIAPNAVKNILAAQNKNKTDTKKTYWGGWAKVRAGMNATYNDYNKFQELENQWAELRAKLGKSAKGHFCWSLINKNRVGVKQEPNATLRFIKNVKIRIAMAKDVLDGKYTETQINDYMNGLSQNYKIKYGLI